MCYFTCLSTVRASLTIPSVTKQIIQDGETSLSLSWDEVTASNTEGQAIVCTADGDGLNVTVSGGIFPIGYHTVTCTVTNDSGCTATRSFSFLVAVGKTEIKSL